MNNLEYLNSKIIKLADWKLLKLNFDNKKVVFTNGCFDILHFGHIQYLAQAKELGDILVVGLNSDNSVKRLKGGNRPINPENARATLLSALFFVDYVIIFEEDTPIHLIEEITPQILVKGGDYDKNTVVGAEWVVKYGGKVEIIDLIPGFSSTEIINKKK